jgi:hypothetical protein
MSMWEREKPNMIDQKFYSNDMISNWLLLSQQRIKEIHEFEKSF